jgi:hypothetical protein
MTPIAFSVPSRCPQSEGLRPGGQNDRVTSLDGALPHGERVSPPRETIFPRRHPSRGHTQHRDCRCFDRCCEYLRGNGVDLGATPAILGPWVTLDAKHSRFVSICGSLRLVADNDILDSSVRSSFLARLATMLVQWSLTREAMRASS